jgi:hypothetical protein
VLTMLHSGHALRTLLPIAKASKTEPNRWLREVTRDPAGSIEPSQTTTPE